MDAYADTIQADRPTSALEGARERLRLEVEELDMAIESLGNSLRPISLSLVEKGSPEAAVPGAPSEPQSEVVADLYAQSNRLSSLTLKIHQLRARLEV